MSHSHTHAHTYVYVSLCGRCHVSFAQPAMEKKKKVCFFYLVFLHLLSQQDVEGFRDLRFRGTKNRQGVEMSEGQRRLL